MSAEQYANLAASALDGGISDVATSLTLIDGSLFSSSGPFRLQIGAELIRAGARSGNSVTGLTRGAEGTTAASHASGDAVTQVLTASSLIGLRALNPRLRLGDPTGLFTAWVNQGAATVDETAGDVLLACAAAGGGSPRLRTKACPGSTPWQADFALIADVDPSESAVGWVAVGFRESGGGKLITLRMMLDSGSIPTLWLDKWNSATSFNTNINTLVINRNLMMQPGPLYLRLQDDGTNLKTFFSLTAGRTWRPALSTTRADFLGAPNQVFIAIKESATYDNSLLLLGYGES